MAQKDELGLFWGQSAFHFLETINSIPKKHISAPYEISKDIANFKFTDTMEGSQLVDVIRATLRDNDIEGKSINLSLPTKDTIFRSFTIPWMQASEIKGVVEFEVSKYIPFKLDELSYTYQTLNFTENKKRQMLVSFVAVRKDTLEIYCGILEHIGLKINFIEPASLSLVRLLAHRKILPKNQTIAVIDTDDISGRIIIVNNNFPQFVREFQLSLPSEAGRSNPDAQQARLFNEVRISLDYFGRQHNQKIVDEIILITSDPNESLPINLREYIDKPVKEISSGEILRSSDQPHTGLLNAFGACLHESNAIDIKFDLPRKSGIADEDSERTSTPNYAATAIIVSVCAALLFATNYFSSRMLTDLSNKSITLKQQLGAYESSSVSDLEEIIKTDSDKLADYKDIQTKSLISLYLTLTPHLMPDGVWLNNISIEYKEARTNRGEIETKILMQFNGYAFLENIDEQVNLVNKFVGNLKSNTSFSENFKEIKLASINRTSLGEFPVMAFNIKCD